MVQVLLGGVFFYAWMWIRWSILSGDYPGMWFSIYAVGGSLIVVCVIEVYLGGIP